MKANEHLLPIPVFRLLLTLTPYAKTTHSSIFYMLPFCLVLLIPFAYSPAAKNCSLIKSPHLPIAGVEGFLEKMDKVKELGVSEIEILSGNLPDKGAEVWVLNHAC